LLDPLLALSRIDIAASDSGIECCRPFLARAAGNVQTFAARSISVHDRFATSLRRCPVRISNRHIAPYSPRPREARQTAASSECQWFLRSRAFSGAGGRTEAAGETEITSCSTAKAKNVFKLAKHLIRTDRRRALGDPVDKLPHVGFRDFAQA
jgi:hypothetical protein